MYRVAHGRPLLVSRELTTEIVLLLSIVGVAVVLFTFEWVPVDVTAIGVMMALVLTRILPPQTAFAGFGSETVLMILGLLIMTAALLRTAARAATRTGSWSSLPFR